jgi:hypothetical protein
MVWDGKVYRHTKFGDISIKGTVKEEERRRQIARMRRRWAEQDARVRELREAEQETQLRWPSSAEGHPGLGLQGLTFPGFRFFM